MGGSAKTPLTSEALFGALDAELEPVRITLLYRLWMLIVAVLMVLLPVVYAGLIVLLGYAVYLHAVHDVVMFESMPQNRGAFVWIAAYVAPIIAGSVAVLFMVKPFFAPKREQFVPLSLERSDQPVLFAFIDKLADAVGAPPPQRIDVDCQVNASASFRRGMRSFLGGDLVLTIGLPLVSGMTLSQFAGVVAHEFGHFAQGGGMRLTYVVRSINHWFARVVYERDAWDDRLDAWVADSGHVLVLLIVLFTKLMVWLSRKVLWLLMMAGHAASCFMLRQMEYDADRYEARLAGSACFVKTTDRLLTLSAAQQAAWRDLHQSFAAGMLPDDLPALIRHHQQELPRDVKHALKAAIESQKTKPFDTHPSHADRVASAQHENEPGVLHFDQPAALLFRDYDKLCRIASAHHYQLVLGERYGKVKLTSTPQLLKRRGADATATEALERFFAGALHPLAPVWPGTDPRKLSIEEAKAKLKALRDAMRKEASAAAALQRQFAEVLAALDNARRAQTLTHANVRIKPAEFGVTSTAGGALADAVSTGMNTVEKHRAKLRDTAGRGAERFALALNALESGQLSTIDADRARKLSAAARRPLAALHALQRQARLFDELCHRLDTAHVCVQVLQSQRTNQDLIAELQGATKKLSQLVMQIHTGLRDVAYPFEHATPDMTLARYLIEVPPPATDIGAVYHAAAQVYERWLELYRQLMSRIAWVGEQGEAALGFKPLALDAAKTQAAQPIAVGAG